MTKQRSFNNAIKWAYAMNWGERAFSALFTFLLAAILGPRDFGIVAMAMIYLTFIQMFLDQGIVAAIVQREDLQPRHLNSVFYFELCLCAVLMGLSLVGSEWWARVNQLPELSAVISTLSISLPLQGLAIVQRSLLQKEMNFRSLSLRSNVSVVAGGIMGLILAVKGYGVWALVGQRIVQDATALVLLWTFSNWRPRWQFSLTSLREILAFSTKGFVGGIGTFVHNQADALLIGLFLGPVSIGLYRLAGRIVSTLFDAATSSVQIVSLSEFSRFQSDPGQLRRSVLACIRLSASTTLPGMAFLAVTSDLLMSALGPQWAPASDPLKILSLVGMALAFANFTGPLLTALSRPLFMSFLTWAVAVVNIGALLVVALWLRDASTWWQVMGVATTRLAIEALLMTPLFVWILMRNSGVRLAEVVKASAPAFLASALLAIALIAVSVSGIQRHLHSILVLIVDSAIGGVIAGSTFYFLDSEWRAQIRSWAGRGARWLGVRGRSDSVGGSS